MESVKTARSVSSEAVPIWMLIDGRPLTRVSFERLFKSVARGFTVMTAADPKDVFDVDGHPRAGVQLFIYRIPTPSVADPESRAAILSLIEKLSGVPLVVLGERDEPEEVYQALSYGVRGYITTSLDPELVLEALKLVRAGGKFVPPQTLQGVVDKSVVEPTSEGTGTLDGVHNPMVDRLTDRERAVVREIAKGSSNKCIARALGIEESTVKVHARQVMRKLSATNRTQVALLARQWCEAPSTEHKR